jgi:acetyl esterase/lipase
MVHVRRKAFGSLVLGAVAMLALNSSAQAQMPDLKFVPIARPADAPAETPLYPGVAPGSETAKQVEAWSRVFLAGRPVGTIARNVTRPTYSVFRPAPGKANGAAVILAPGGANLSLSMETEGWAAARWLADHGVTAFVLKYRVKETPADQDAYLALSNRTMAQAAKAGAASSDMAWPLGPKDAEELIRQVRAQAQTFGVDPHRVGLVGFSAGARNTLSVVLENDPASRPDFFGLIYPEMLAVTPPADGPPMFVAIARDDFLYGRQGFGLVESWQKAKLPVELHFFDGGNHGFGMVPTGTTSQHWIDEFYWWLQARGLLQPKP